jgi:protein N-terminal glutamine amidohydrolase
VCSSDLAPRRWYTAPVRSIDRESLDYQPYYCEENVWRLLARPELEGLETWAVLVSNAERDVTLLRQVAGRPVDGLVHWDYHVFAVAEAPVEGRVALDLDSELPFPCPLGRYLEDSFPEGVQRALEPRFRVLRGVEYLDGLVSDRSHMRRPDGSWIAPPPPWPAPGSDAVTASGPGNRRPTTLMPWLDVGRHSPGSLFDSARMAAFASGRNS